MNVFANPEHANVAPNVDRFVDRLKNYHEVLTLAEYRKLRDKALGGDLNGANELLDSILSRRIV